MSEQTSATGTGAKVPTETEKQIETAVSQVREARSKEARLRGMPEMAKLFKDGGKSTEKSDKQAQADPGEAAAEKPGEKASEPAAEAQQVATQQPEDLAKARTEADAKAFEDRKAKRRDELAALAKSGREKWQASQAQKRELSDLAKQKADLAARAKEIAEQKALLEEAKKDPFKFLERSGVPPEELAKRVVRRADPVAQAEDLRAELEAYKREQAEEAKQRQDEWEKSEQRRQQAQAQARQRDNEIQFVQLASNQDKYPSLNALYEPSEILAKAYSAIQAARAAAPNVIYTDDEIADFLEKEAAPRLAKLRGEQPRVVAQSEKQSTTQIAAAASAKASPTLNSTLVSEGGLDTAAFKKLPRAKQNAILAERLNAARKGK